MMSCMQIKEDFNKKKEEEKEARQTLVEDWMKIKNKEIKKKRRMRREKKLEERKQIKAKKDNAQRGIKNY